VIKGSSHIIGNGNSWGFGEHEAVDCNLFENNCAKAIMLLATELELIEDTVEFFDQAFDIPCRTDVKGLVLSCFNTMNKATFLRAIITSLFVDSTIIAYQMALWGKTMRDRHVRELILNIAD
jgi:hypothetical protein